MWGQYLLSVFLGEEGWWFNCFTALKHVEKWSSTFISFSSGRVPNRFHIWVNYGQSRPHVIVTYIDFKLRLVFLPLHWLKYASLYPFTMHEKFLFYIIWRRWYQFLILRYILQLFWNDSFDVWYYSWCLIIVFYNQKFLLRICNYSQSWSVFHTLI